jgi:flagellar biosynthesis anti-sigma factor FlgM
MKIDGQIPKVPVQDKGIQKGKEEATDRLESRKTDVLKKSTTENFSIKKLQSRIEAEPDMDLKKIRELRDRIKRGEYKVDNEKLAEGLLKDSLIDDIS